MGLLSKIIGQKKEQDASTYLQSKQLQVIQQNYHCKGGEIDLICLDTSRKSDPVLIFVEVKHRKNANFGSAEEAVNLSKQRKVIHCAQRFLHTHPEYQDHAMRFDTLCFTAQQTAPNWIQNAFWLE